MKVCFVGTGSMGKRHIKNLLQIMKEKQIECQIDVLRHWKTKLDSEISEMVSQEYFSFADAPDDYDIVFITNPTSLHYETLKELFSKGQNFFIEKPIFESSKYDVSNFILSGKNIYVACPLRYTKTLQEVKKIAEKEKIYSVRAICSSYLPEWRPSSDYTKSYSAKKELGGGVEIDLIHEWDYLTDLFGFPQEISYMGAKTSGLDIETNDIAVYIAKYADKVSSLSLDYFGRVLRRQIEFCTAEDVIVADITAGKIKWLKTGREMDTCEDRDVYQKRELENFLDIIDGKCANNNNIERALKVLKLTEGEI